MTRISSIKHYLGCKRQLFGIPIPQLIPKAYCSTADGDELLTSFRCTYKKTDEKASEYLLPPYTLLTQVVEVDGI